MSVFANPESGFRPRSTTWLTNKFSDVLWRLGLKRKRNLTLHSTRHMMATKMIKAGVSIPVVMKAGGWKNASTLLEVYAEADQKETDKALRDNFLSDKKKKKAKVEQKMPPGLVLLGGKKDDGLNKQKKRGF